MTAPLSKEQLIEAKLSAVLPRDVVFAMNDPRMTSLALDPCEQSAIAQAGVKRQLEFAAGRTAAREAMSRLGAGYQCLPSTPDRAPIWPAGLVGNLSHDDTLCLALVAKTERIKAIGVDVEPALALTEDVIRETCSMTEQKWIASQYDVDAGLSARRIFSAKECAYKCQYPLTKEMFGFETFEITLSDKTAGFTAEFTRDVGPFTEGSTLAGYSIVVAGHILSLMILENQPGS